MEIKTYYALDIYGNAIANATVTIYLEDGVTLAPQVYNEDGSPLTNPFTTDATGRATFQVPDGMYEMGIANSRSEGYRVPFQAFDLGTAQEIGTRSLVGGIDNGDVATAGDTQTNWQIQNTTSLFPSPAENETSNQFNSGPWDDTRVLTVPEVLDEIQFKLFDNVAFPYTILPYQKIDGLNFVCPLLGITSVGHSGPVGANPFRATGNYSAGVTTFRNVSGRVLSGVLRGSFTLLLRLQFEQSPESIRLAGLAPNRAPDTWFCMVAPDGDGLNARDRYAMSIVSNWGQIPSFKMIQQPWSVPIPSYADLVPLLSGVTPKAHTVASGGINGNSVDETLVVNANGFTTSWIPVGGETLWHVTANGTSSTCRIQFKDAGGNIWYDHRQSSNGVTGAVNTVIQCNPLATQMRICFRLTASDTATDLTILPLPNTIDPCVGTWARYEFNVHQHVDFLPNVDYNFQFAFFNGAGGTYDENSFVIPSGGLGFFYDSRPERYLNVKKVKGIV